MPWAQYNRLCIEIMITMTHVSCAPSSSASPVSSASRTCASLNSAGVNQRVLCGYRRIIRPRLEGGKQRVPYKVWKNEAIRQDERT